MDASAAARPYAQAAYQHAAGAGTAGQWEEMLSALAAISATGPFRQLIADPRLGEHECGQALEAMLTASQIDEQGAGRDFRSFCRQLLAGGRLAAAGQIAAQFGEIRRLAEKIVDVKIYSAFALSEQQVGRIGEALKKRLACREVRTELVIDESLGGGVRIVAGDDVIDATVTAELDRLRSHVLSFD